MKTNFSALSKRKPNTLALGLFAALLATPATSGIVIPDSPLQSGSVVPPNIMFILDDSGSMGLTYMAAPEATSDSAPATDAPDIGQQTYARNGIYYNPSINYDPWRNFSDTGNYVADTPYSAVYTNATLASGGTANLASSTQTYYVPKTDNSLLAYVRNPVNYWRYQILTGGTQIMRAERVTGLPSSAIATLAVTGSVTNGNYSTSYNFVVPANVSNVTFTSMDGTGTNADMYVLFNGLPTTGAFTCRSRNGGTNNETCNIANPAAGTWQVRMFANGGTFDSVNLATRFETMDANGCDNNSQNGAGWGNCTNQTSMTWVNSPTVSYTRNVADEKQNFATWYSFNRTRNKVAKAGAGKAFAELPETFRVGFTTIWDRNTYLVPVASDNGLFRNKVFPDTPTNNRSLWFDRLYAANASGSTPLLPALQRTGEYYKDASDSGPYGPESGSTQLACRQNFAILTTDGFWNDTTGYTPVGNADNTVALPIPLPAGALGAPIGYNPTTPYIDNFTAATGPVTASTWSNTLADVANHYWKTDLSTLENIVPSGTTDPAYWQHMVTYGVSIGLKGTLDPVLDLAALKAGTRNTNGTIGWPNPIPAENPTRIDDLFHASVNGRGKFIAALDATQFSKGLRDALAGIAEAQASNSNASANSTSLETTGRIFQASYTSGKWTGELRAFNIVTSGVINATAAWSASALIPAAGSRNILTWDGPATTGAGATFPTSTQNTALTPAVSSYIRGVRTGEGTTFRARDHLLGDIVNSSPAYVSETNSVYVGANDGMLHGFNAADGVEQFAYVPLGINLINLKSLSVEPYVHRYFVDGSIVVSTRRQTTGVSNFIAPNNNKNILIGALGRGGKGVFALDVTNPASMTTTNVKWESGADVDMGNVLGRPFIAKLNNGMAAAIVANGPNSNDEKAVLFIYNLNTGALIQKIDTLAGTVANPNGLSSPVGWDDDNDGDLDYIYSGDLHGNMWRFDVRNGNPNNWALAAQRTILHTALSPTSVPQPIYGRPTVARDPTTYKRWVFFGTGRFLTTGDSNDQRTQSWYGIQDNGVNIATRSDLQLRKIAVAGTITIFLRDPITNALILDGGGNPISIGTRSVRGFEPAAPLPPTKFGWYIDLLSPPTPPGTQEGERMVGDQRVTDNILLAASIIPGSTGCTVGGRGFINAIDAFTGSSLSSANFDVDGDGEYDDDTIGGVPVGSVDIGVGMGTNPLLIGNVLIQSGSTGNLRSIRQRDSNRIGRISWREVLGN